MMERIGILFTLLIVLSASQCKKEGEDCHKNISIKNNSSSSVIFATKGFFANSDSCNLAGDEFAPNESWEFGLLRICWEEELMNGRKQEIYVIDPSHYNDPSEFYDCDSIEIRNTILRKYELALEDLQASDFTVTYP